MITNSFDDSSFPRRGIRPIALGETPFVHDTEEDIPLASFLPPDWLRDLEPSLEELMVTSDEALPEEVTGALDDAGLGERPAASDEPLSTGFSVAMNPAPIDEPGNDLAREEAVDEFAGPGDGTAESFILRSHLPQLFIALECLNPAIQSLLDAGRSIRRHPDACTLELHAATGLLVNASSLHDFRESLIAKLACIIEGRPLAPLQLEGFSSQTKPGKPAHPLPAQACLQTKTNKTR